jgi:hypothetical protein
VNKEPLSSEDEFFDDKDKNYSAPVRNAPAKKIQPRTWNFRSLNNVMMRLVSTAILILATA